MANFLTAFAVTMQAEGGYNPGSGEAETYMGVDRSQHPTWNGWSVIDGIKRANPGTGTAALNALFKANASLQSNVQQLYLNAYWNPFQLNAFTDQQAANAIFDCSVNPCIIPAANAAQMACNTIKHGLIKVDGQFGQKTLAGINSLPPDLFVTAFNGIRTANYYERVKLTPADSQWLSSWLERCKAYQ